MDADAKTRLQRDERGQIGELLTLVVGLVVLYAAWAISFRYLYPLEESILADGILAVRGVFIDALGPAHGPWAFLAVVVALVLLFNAVVFTDYIGPDMTVEE